MTSLPDRRRGMTLVELLVVVAIVGLLAVTVLPNVASTTESRRTREATRIASTFIARAQSRAIGRPEWAGVTLVPPQPTLPYAIDLIQATVPQVYRGESFGSTATISATDTGFSRGLTFSDGIPDARNVNKGDLIRFDGSGPWYEIADKSGGVYKVSFRGFNGVQQSMDSSTQTERNTPWPTVGVGHSFEILRQPVWSGQAFTIADGRCIDLTWSGFGSPTEFDGNRFFRPPATSALPVTIMFDATGRVRQIFRTKDSPVPRLPVTGPVYLLVGRVDRATNDPTLPSTYDGVDDSKGFNWQYGDSFWIAIDPASGLVRTAECNPVTGPIDVTDASLRAQALVTSQQFIRSETPVGGR